MGISLKMSSIHHIMFFSKLFCRSPSQTGGYQTPLDAVPFYTPCSARAASLSTLLRFSRPFSDQGKWATGMRKKELLGSAIPARALYLVRVLVMFWVSILVDVFALTKR